MTTSLMVFQAIISVLLIILVLLQFGKGAEAGLMSQGGADSVFTGGQQGNILSKITIVLSILFLGNSILLAKIQGQSSSASQLDNEAPISRPLNSDAAMPKNSPIKKEGDKAVENTAEANGTSPADTKAMDRDSAPTENAEKTEEATTKKE